MAYDSRLTLLVANGRFPLTGKYRFVFKVDDPAFGRAPRAAARSRHRRTEEYVEESDAATTKLCT